MAERTRSNTVAALIAARQCEVAGLEHLGRAVKLVGVVRALIHDLQRERGASNLFVGSRGQRYAEPLQRYRADADQAEDVLHIHLAQWLTPESRAPQCSRLLGAIALVLDGLSRLPSLRAAISDQNIEAAALINRFNDLIRHLLAVVFEAADAAVDPAVSRALVCLFNLMQGKEFAGQERAIGVAGFSQGWGDATLRQMLVHRIDAQERCFRIFMEFAIPDSLELWQESMTAPCVTELERLRRVACTASAEILSAGSLDFAELWFAHATDRIDRIQEIEARLEQHLLELSEQRLAQSRAELEDTRAWSQAAVGNGAAGSKTAAVILGKPLPLEEHAHSGPWLEIERQRLEGHGALFQTSLLDLVHTQSQQLHAISDELAAARDALKERKLVEHAKALLMKHRDLTEDQAYRLLRQTAMNQNRRLAEVAEATVAMADLLRS
jgi:hypothetical protein